MIGGGSPRVPQPIDRRTIQARPEQIRRTSENSAAAVDPNGSSNQRRSLPAGGFSDTKRLLPKWLMVTIIALIVALVVGGLAWSVFKRNISGEIDKNKNQAVFLESGQVYFGKLQVLNEQYLKLTDVFYVQSGATEQTGEGQNPEVPKDNKLQLIKLGDEVHGPEDAMIINRDRVLFFENLKPDAEVSKLISQYKSK